MCKQTEDVGFLQDTDAHTGSLLGLTDVLYIYYLTATYK